MSANYTLGLLYFSKKNLITIQYYDLLYTVSILFLIYCKLLHFILSFSTLFHLAITLVSPYFILLHLIALGYYALFFTGFWKTLLKLRYRNSKGVTNQTHLPFRYFHMRASLVFSVEQFKFILDILAIQTDTEIWSETVRICLTSLVLALNKNVRLRVDQ